MSVALLAPYAARAIGQAAAIPHLGSAPVPVAAILSGHTTPGVDIALAQYTQQQVVDLTGKVAGDGCKGYSYELTNQARYAATEEGAQAFVLAATAVGLVNVGVKKWSYWRSGQIIRPIPPPTGDPIHDRFSIAQRRGERLRTWCFDAEKTTDGARLVCILAGGMLASTIGLPAAIAVTAFGHVVNIVGLYGQTHASITAVRDARHLQQQCQLMDRSMLSARLFYSANVQPAWTRLGEAPIKCAQSVAALWCMIGALAAGENATKIYTTVSGGHDLNFWIWSTLGAFSVVMPAISLAQESRQRTQAVQAGDPDKAYFHGAGVKSGLLMLAGAALFAHPVTRPWGMYLASAGFGIQLAGKYLFHFYREEPPAESGWLRRTAHGLYRRHRARWLERHPVPTAPAPPAIDHWIVSKIRRLFRKRPPQAMTT